MQAMFDNVRNGDFKAQEGAFPLLGSIWMHLDHYNEVSTLISGRDMFKPLCLFNLGWKGNRIIHNSLTTLNTDNIAYMFGRMNTMNRQVGMKSVFLASKCPGKCDYNWLNRGLQQ